MKETIGFNPESPEKKADLPGINLSSCDLMVLLAASKGNNRQWIPGQEIQISGNKEQLPYGWSEIVSKSYAVRREGKGRGNIILSPKGVDEKFRQLVSEVSLERLKPLINLFHSNLSAIDSLTLLPNTSLGVRITSHFNGLIINLNKYAKDDIKKLISSLHFPWGRSVLVCKLGIYVEAFVSNFADGNGLTPFLQPYKFLDFLRDDKGIVYVVLGGGEKRENGLDVSGSKDVVKKRLNTLYSSATDYLVQKAKILKEKIGVGFEVVTAYPYVGYDPESQTVFSGLPAESNYPKPNYVLYNPHPTLNLNCYLHEGSLIGAYPNGPVAKIVGLPSISGTPLTRVATRVGSTS